ncbi:hypothetical protein Tco_1177688, partial [Tanacetum coccineum]
PITDEVTNEEHVSTPSYDPSQSGKDRMQLNELMDLCAKLSDRVLALENTNTSQATKIVTLKESVKKLEKKRRSKTYKPRRLHKGRKIADLDADEEVTLIDETQERNDEEMLFDVNNNFQGEEVIVEKEVGEKEVSAVDPPPLVTTAGEVVTTASATTTVDEFTLAQTMIEIKAAKLKAVTTAATTITTVVTNTRLKAKGIIFHDQEEQAHTSTHTKKDQIALDEELVLRLHAEEQAELERMQKERVAQEETSREAIIKELDSIQAMIDANEQLATRLQAEEQE